MSGTERVKERKAGEWWGVSPHSHCVKTCVRLSGGHYRHRLKHYGKVLGSERTHARTDVKRSCKLNLKNITRRRREGDKTTERGEERTEERRERYIDAWRK